MVYAGIGSRRTPGDIFELMVECARLLASRGWTLRSGGAKGADTAFANGAYLWAPKVELYLPFHRYNGHQYARLYSPTDAAYRMAERYHPVWGRLEAPARTLMARNCHVILGPELDDPVSRIICWTPDGTLDGQGPDSGGTGHALRVAAGEAPAAKVTNLARQEDAAAVWQFTGMTPLQGSLFQPS